MIGELTNHVWQSTLFAAAAGLLTVAFRKNRAKVRYWLWFGASVKFFVPFALLMSLGSHLGSPAAKQIATPAVSFAVEQFSQPFPVALSSVPSTARPADWVPLAIFGIWAFGFSGVALIRFRGWSCVRAAVRSSVPIDMPAAVEIRSSPGLLEPGVVGLWRPILLLPAGIAERLTPAQLEAVLAHELCHVRRRDNLFASIHMIVEAIFWFHPLVWWIGARLLEERERACDEEVLSLGGEAHVYAEGILNVCKLYVESPLVCVAGVTGSNIKRRIEAIMANRTLVQLTFAKKAGLAVAVMAAVAAPVVVGMMHAPAIRAQTAPAVQAPAVKPSVPESREASVKAVPPGRPMAPQMLAQALPGGRSMGPQSAATPAADDERARRVAYAKEKYGNTVFGMGGTYVQYGPPDEIEGSVDIMQNSQIWRYRYLEDFGSSVEFEFPGGGQNMRIKSPRPLATFEGEPAVADELVGELSRMSKSQGFPVAPNAIAGLPGGHASMLIYPSRNYRTLSIPLVPRSGKVRIIGEVRTRSDTEAPGRVAANFVDSPPARAGAWQMNFTLDAGSYVCSLVVQEQATGQMYGETIHFEAR